ncbi:MAG: menaquinone biosynthesis protein [Acidobacteria bacterium]|nr:menaquinone biosynthesis protein [Acidobacteriota bacterium]
MPTPLARPRVAAVSYLNTVPLIWGLEHGPSRGAFDMQYCVPSECADRMRRGDADIGLIPVIEMARQGFDYCPGTGIACDGEVRSILLISKVPPAQIRTVVADSGSRTSVMLARVILDSVFDTRPSITVASPLLGDMLLAADAALVIGDPALHIEPAALPYHVLDLGAEWKRFTGLPMVFAMWSGAPQFTTEANSRVFVDSLRFGMREMDTIVAAESAERGLPLEMVRTYLTRHIRFELGENEYEGLRTYLRHAARLEPTLLIRDALTVTP